MHRAALLLVGFPQARNLRVRSGGTSYHLQDRSNPLVDLTRALDGDGNITLRTYQANRLRMRVMEQVDAALGDLDLFIGSNQAITNRTGHPVVSIPNGFSHGSPTALHLTGKLFGEAEILLLAHAFQAKTDFHLRHPRL